MVFSGQLLSSKAYNKYIVENYCLACCEGEKKQHCCYVVMQFFEASNVSYVVNM